MSGETPPSAAEIRARNEQAERELADLKPMAQRAIAQLKRGKRVEQELGRWLVAMAPVTADESSCLGCHRAARKGEGLGALIYLVNRKPADQ